MKSTLKHKLAALLGGIFLATAPAHASITFTGNSGDLFFLYDSVANNWVTAFRAKGTAGQPTTTGATGLTNPFNADSTPSTWVGIQGNEATTTAGNTGDYLFDTLQVNVSSAPMQMVNGNNYLITPANGSSIYNDASSNPDLGIRIRLREDQDAMGIWSGNVDDPKIVDQFTNMRLTLDWAASTKPTGADFVLFGWNDPSTPLYDTSVDNLTHDWGIWGHNHWHYGFSEVGDYTLVFNIDGIGGIYGGTDNPSSVSINFNVIPEPSTALLGMIALGALGLRRRRA